MMRSKAFFVLISIAIGGSLGVVTGLLAAPALPWDIPLILSRESVFNSDPIVPKETMLWRKKAKG